MASKPVVWDVAVVCTCANSYEDASAHKAGAVVQLAAAEKMVKYSELLDQYTFIWMQLKHNVHLTRQLMSL